VNVTIENLNACRKLIRFEIDANAVEEAFKNVTSEFGKHAAIPGFRPGKAPPEMIQKQFGEQIEKEVRRKLVADSYQQALKDHKIDVLSYPDIEDIQFNRGQAFLFAATVETSPDFEIPDYHGLEAQREMVHVTDADVDKAINALREQKATFEVVERPLADGNVAVVNYKGTCDGKPLTDLAPTVRGLTQKDNFWVAISKDSFIPGFTDGLVGAGKGDHRTIELDFPLDFVSDALAGKHAVYEVDVVEVRERRLPQPDDEFAKAFGADSLDHLRKGVRQDLKNEINTRQRRSIRNQLVKALLAKVNFDLPESFVNHETRNVVYDIVNENQKRGVPKEAIDKSKDNIYAAANQTAKDRVKLGFLVHRIADAEGIRAVEGEVQARIAALAQSYDMAPKKLLKELEKRNGVSEIYQQIIHEKVIDFLQEYARIQDVEPAALPAEPTPESPAPEPPPAEESK